MKMRMLTSPNAGAFLGAESGAAPIRRKPLRCFTTSALLEGAQLIETERC